MKDVSDKIKRIIDENSAKIVQEVRETKELYQLLVKWSKEGTLTELEKEKVKTQLLDIAKTVPALAIFIVPFGSLILLFLIKTLPFNILPSSFSADKKDNDETTSQ